MSAPTTYRGANGDAGEGFTALPTDLSTAASCVRRGGDPIYDSFHIHAPPLPGRAPLALHVASRESNFQPRAYNSYSGASGIFQHLRRYWPGRADSYGFGGWSAFNARANIMVTMRM